MPTINTESLKRYLKTRGRYDLKQYNHNGDVIKIALHNDYPGSWTATIRCANDDSWNRTWRNKPSKAQTIKAVCNYIDMKQGIEPTPIEDDGEQDMSKFKDLTNGGTTRHHRTPQPQQQDGGVSVQDLLGMVIGPKIDEEMGKIDEKVQARTDEIIELNAQRAKEESEKGLVKAKEEITKLIEKLSTPTTVSIQRDIDDEAHPELAHYKFPSMAGCVKAGVNPMLVGPAGSGKTTAAKQLADSLGLPFYFSGAMSGLHQLNGFIDANGVYHDTQTYKAFKDGGVLLLDELDAGHPEVLVGTNMLVENGMHDFPVGRINKHKDFIVICAANTFGRGADRMYVGRNQLDAATLDRFAVIDWDYDEAMERTLANNDELVDVVQKMRRGVAKAKIRHVISPRASIYGAKLIKHGNFTVPQVMEMVVFKGLPPEQVKKIKSNAA